MTIYDRPTKSLMAIWANESLKPDQTFAKSDATRWFAQHYPNIKRNTVEMHVESMSTNNRLRKHYPSIKPGSGHDLLYKLGPDQFRLWNQYSDPAPLYKQDLDKQASSEAEDGAVDDGAAEEATIDVPAWRKTTNQQHCC